MGRVNVDFYRSVKVNMNLEDARRYQPFHKGLDINFYEPVSDRGENLLKVKGYNTKKINNLDVTITAKSVNPNPLHERDLRDIDEELAMMDSKYRVIQDHLKHTDNKKLTHFHQPVNTLMRHATVLEHPYLEGQNDHLKSTAKEVHEVEIPLETIREHEKKFEKRKAFYNKSKMKYVAKMNKELGIKTVKMQMGYIGDYD